LLTNRMLFTKDPLTTTIPNDGVAKVTEPQSAQEWDVLRYELTSFVCGGEYRSGMDRILSTYLAHLGENTQPAVWVSGFYGSGKSHMVRTLEYLWQDVEFPNGARARGLASLPDEIAAHFQELSIAGRREGGLWSAAGTLGAGAGDSVRLALLAILFRSAGLPEQYPAACFVLWLKQNGLYEQTRHGVEAQGKSFESELRSMYVSPVLANSLLAAAPEFAQSGAEVRQLLKAQYPIVADITDDALVATMSDVLALKSSTPGKIPCTLIVLDELQQYAGENADRTLRIQTVVEACSARFGSRILFVATGQSALQASTQLSKLQGRFTVTVALSDKDVETVVREVVLRKQEDKKADVRAMLSQCSGEIDRHLLGTKVAPNASDTSEVMVADYPLLPVRRRFWERVLRAVDSAGVAGQLRTQLRVVHEAVREVGDRPLGHVVAADRIYKQLVLPMRQAGTLLREVEDIIARQEDGTAEGTLRMRLCATLFLISQLPTGAGADSGIHATADTLADLLVEDLTAGSASLRKRIPDLLAGMLENGELMQVGEEYRLQTREGAAWEQDYRKRNDAVAANESRIASDRSTALRTACAQALKDVSITQGASKTVRKIELSFAPDSPSADTGAVPIWIRDEWAVGEKTVREEAQAAGADSSIVCVYLPKRNPDDFKRALAGLAAATETLDARGVPPTREGQEAKQGMETRRADLTRQVGTFVSQILRDAKIYQGGGNEIAEGDLRASVQEAMKQSLARLYPQFDAADYEATKWNKVKERARQGAGDALTAIGYQGDVEKQTVCLQVLGFVGGAGKKGIDIRKRFEGSPYGWPKDAADAALLALVVSGHLRAEQNGSPVGVQHLDNVKLGQTEFRAEGVTVTPIQRIGIRKLLADAGMNVKTNEEALALPNFLAQMTNLATAAGGLPPLPLRPDTAHLEALKSLTGNAQLLSVHDQRERLAQEAKDWKQIKQQADIKLSRWQILQRLLDQAQAVPSYAQVKDQADAITANRSLLTNPDPVPLLCGTLTDDLRAAVKAAREKHLEAYDAKITDLYSDPLWQRLSESDQKQIQTSHGLNPLPLLKVGNETELLATLDSTPLKEWENKTAAIAERVKAALLEAARRVEPKAERVTLPSFTLKTEADVDAYLEKVRAAIMLHIEAGNPVVV
jgi:hypothetical protein